MDRKLPLTIEELINMGDFDKKELIKLYSEITNVILKKQHLEESHLRSQVKPSFKWW